MVPVHGGRPFTSTRSPPPSRDEIAALLDDLTDEDLRRLLARWTVEEYGL